MSSVPCRGEQVVLRPVRKLVRFFTSPVTRPRAILWTMAATILLGAVLAGALMATSTRWFCMRPCHKVHDDNTAAYEKSVHSEVACLACHMPVNTNALIFTIHKIEVLPDIWATAANTYKIPINHESEIAERMGSEYCTQCHNLKKRRVTPSTGIIIDHEKHSKKGIACTKCHNRVAHPEGDIKLVLSDPKTGKPAVAHEDWMKMEGCFRECHALEGGDGPGDCSACHPKGFELKPESHLEPGFYQRGGESSGHWKAKKAEPEYCGICHVEKKFCADCHGIEMPHPADFEKKHGDVGKSKPRVCANCHAAGKRVDAVDTRFCNGCHHKGSDPSRPWIPQHFMFVKQLGADACFDCHKPTYCAACHVRGLRN